MAPLPTAPAAASENPSSPLTSYERGPDERINKLSSIPFILVHFVPLLAVFTGVTATALVLLFVTYFGRLFFVTAGYHRYFAHRSYKLARVPQFLMAFGGTMAAQKGPLWWASHHREHHRNSDTEQDIHSPLRGFWWSHVGWILCDKYNDAPVHRIKDFSRYPELRFLDRANWIGPWALAVACFLIGGWSGLVIGFFLSTVLVWHGTFLINSLAHVMGRRRYATEDTSKNSAILAVVTMGEGWHNNHHYYQGSARQGFFWWEWDPSYYALRALSWVGIVKDLKRPPKAALASNRIKQGAFDIGMFRAHWVRAARAVSASRESLGSRIADSRTHAADAFADQRELLAERRHCLEEAVAEKRQSLEESLGQRKETLEGFVHGSLESAEELARLSRLRQRELGLSSE